MIISSYLAAKPTFGFSPLETGHCSEEGAGAEKRKELKQSIRIYRHKRSNSTYSLEIEGKILKMDNIIYI